MAFLGNLRHYRINDILRLIGDSSRRGRIVIERPGLQAMLYCESGQLIAVWRSGANPSLAQRWVNNNIISLAVLRQMGTALNLDLHQMPDQQFAKTAVDMQIVTYEQVEQWALFDATELIGYLMTWRDGDYRFEEGFMPPMGTLVVPILIARVLTTMAQRPMTWTASLPTIAVGLDAVLELIDIDLTTISLIRITREQWQIINYIDGLSSIMNIARILTQNTLIGNAVDQQRFEIELRRTQERVQRIASELLQQGLVLLVQPSDASTSR